MQNKSGTASTIPLDVYFFQRRRHGCHMAFSLLESMHGIVSPVWIDSHHAIIQRKTKATGIHPNLCVESLRQCELIPIMQFYPESCYISRKTKAVQFPPIPLDVYFLPTQTARLPHGVFSTRICASNRSANADT